MKISDLLKANEQIDSIWQPISLAEIFASCCPPEIVALKNKIKQKQYCSGCGANDWKNVHCKYCGNCKY